MCPNWFGLLGVFSSLVSILFYFKNFPLLVIQQAKSVNKYIITLATTVDVAIGINGHVITVTYSCLGDLGHLGHGQWDTECFKLSNHDILDV